MNYVISREGSRGGGGHRSDAATASSRVGSESPFGGQRGALTISPEQYQQSSSQASQNRSSKQYISQLETQLRASSQRKQELVDKNQALESLLRLQDEKLQTQIEELKQLRSSFDAIFKENKTLCLRMDGFANEKSALSADNVRLRDELKKAEARLSLPHRPALPKKHTTLKTIAAISRENNYTDTKSLANDSTLKQFRKTGGTSALKLGDGSAQSSDDILREQLYQDNLQWRDTVDNQRYEIRLLNQALSEDETQGKITSRLISQLVEAQASIVASEKLTLELKERILSYEALVQSYTHSHNNLPRDMDRASIERKNIFLQTENQLLHEQIKTGAKAIAEAACQTTEEIEQPQQMLASNYETFDWKLQQSRTSKPTAAARNFPSTMNGTARNLPPTMKTTTIEKKRLSLTDSLKSQGIDKINKQCCTQQQPLSSKSTAAGGGGLVSPKQRRVTIDQGLLATNSGNYSMSNLDVPGLCESLRVEKNKNALLSRMVEEEQEKLSEYYVYKEEMDYYINKNRALTQEVNQMNLKINQMSLVQSPRQTTTTRGLSTDRSERSPRRRVGSSSSPDQRLMSKMTAQLTASDEDIASETKRLAGLQIDRELQTQLARKEKQLDNVIRSRALLQRTLGDQLSSVQAANEALLEEKRHLQNQVTVFESETAALKTLVRRAERKNLLGGRNGYEEGD